MISTEKTSSGAIFLSSFAARLDVGLPMIAVILPWGLAALVPVVALEAWILARRLSLDLWSSVTAALVANLTSTFLGVPVTWILLVVVQAFAKPLTYFGDETILRRLLTVTFRSAWLTDEYEFWWMIPWAAFLLLVPFFFASWLVEYLICRWVLTEVSAAAVKRAVMLANLASYTCLAVIVLVVAARAGLP